MIWYNKLTFYNMFTYSLIPTIIRSCDKRYQIVCLNNNNIIKM